MYLKVVDAPNIRLIFTMLCCKMMSSGLCGIWYMNMYMVTYITYFSLITSLTTYHFTGRCLPSLSLPPSLYILLHPPLLPTPLSLSLFPSIFLSPISHPLPPSLYPSATYPSLPISLSLSRSSTPPSLNKRTVNMYTMLQDPTTHSRCES